MLHVCYYVNQGVFGAMFKSLLIRRAEKDCATDQQKSGLKSVVQRFPDISLVRCQHTVIGKVPNSRTQPEFQNKTNPPTRLTVMFRALGRGGHLILIRRDIGPVGKSEKIKDGVQHSLSGFLC